MSSIFAKAGAAREHRDRWRFASLQALGRRFRQHEQTEPDPSPPRSEPRERDHAIEEAPVRTDATGPADRLDAGS